MSKRNIQTSDLPSSVVSTRQPSGDTTGATDTAALNAAGAALNAAGGGTLLLAKGTFYFNSIFELYSNVQYQGSGRGATTLTPANSADLYAFIRNYNFTAGGDTNISLTACTINGNSASQATYSQGLSMQDVTGVTVDCAVTNCLDEGIVFSGCQNVRVDIDASYTGRDGVVFQVDANDVPCSDVHGFVRTRYCGLTAITSVASGSNGQTLPQATIYLTNTAGLTSSGTVNIVTTMPYSSVEVSCPVAYTGVSGNTITGCTGGYGTMATGNLASQPNRSGLRLPGCTDFDLTYQSYYSGFHGVDLSNSYTSNGRIKGSSTLCGRYGVYCGLGPTLVEIEANTTGSGYGGFGSEYTPPWTGVQFRGTSDGDAYGAFLDTATGVTCDLIVMNAVKHGIAVSGCDHCDINLRLGYNNSQLTDNTYSDIYVCQNSDLSSIHPAAVSTKNDIRIGVSLANGTNKVLSAIQTAESSDTYNRFSIGAIDGAHNPTQFSGLSAGTSSTRDFITPSGGVNPTGIYLLNSSGSVQVDTRNGRTQATTLTGAMTLTILAGYAAGDDIILMLSQNATGGYAVTFSGANWRIGSYSNTTTASKRDMLRLVWDGTYWNLASVEASI